MTRASRWLLPAGVDEIIPPHAAMLETLRRRMLDTMASWGYALCMPASVEFLDSLVSDGGDLELQTFKLTDQVSGRMLGIPADMTPQIARIDAHRIGAAAPTRLCYIGSVLHTRPDQFAGSRNPLQLGAELYGHAGIASDAEVISLMVVILALAGVGEITLDLGHMALFHGLATAAQLDAEAEALVLDALLRKAGDELQEILARARVPPAAATWLLALLSLNGDREVLTRAAVAWAAAPAAVQTALGALVALVDELECRCPALNVHLDLADLRGYQYHTGVMFAAYTVRMGRAIAWGGRYDNIGARFGRARAATGFSTDLKLLAALAASEPPVPAGVFAPTGTQASLLAAIDAARAAGRVVIQALPGQSVGAQALGCNARLCQVAGDWQIEPLG
ncbi:MAG: ATP phosphoribosyltransferase regulatory subunit [Gammaproteobacteria bacterium]|nr:ATP phosphoribosyltransferase regulatory subunit [Gammaproteobacteria bacterium]